MSVTINAISTTQSVIVRVFQHDYDFYASDDYEERV